MKPRAGTGSVPKVGKPQLDRALAPLAGNGISGRRGLLHARESSNEPLRLADAVLEEAPSGSLVVSICSALRLGSAQ